MHSVSKLAASPRLLGQLSPEKFPNKKVQVLDFQDLENCGIARIYL